MNVKRLSRLYFETSALNWLESRLSWEAALNTKAYQNLRGRGYYISPLVIFEVLTTKDADRREQLIFFAQHLFEPVLLPSPEELILNYIAAGCPRSEKEYNLISKGQMASHWRGICEDTRKTLFYDSDSVQAQSHALRELGRLLFEFHTHRTVTGSIDKDVVGANFSAYGLISQYRLVPELEMEEPQSRQRYGLVVLLIVLVLCAGLSPDRNTTDEYWRSIGTLSLAERVDYTFTRFPQLVVQGPFHLLATVIDVHVDRTFSRGMIFDCLHAVYALYADTFLTADPHFVEMRKTLAESWPAASKIVHIDEGELRWIPTSDAPPAKGWLDP